MEAKQTRQNYLGVGGWVWGGRYKLERYLYTLHRLTGLGIVFYGAMHLMVMTVFRGQGEATYTALMNFFANPLFKVGEFLVVIAFIYHGVNGLRLIAQELGYAMGKPIPPVYPYKDALRKKRPLTYAVLAIIIVLSCVALFSFVKGGA
jgi:succinate dehydrogenase / fumarate reductase cytochrome b subunit